MAQRRRRIRRATPLALWRMVVQPEPELGNGQPSELAQRTSELGRTRRAAELSSPARDDPRESAGPELSTAASYAPARSEQPAAEPTEPAGRDRSAASEPGTATDNASRQSAAGSNEPTAASGAAASRPRTVARNAPAKSTSASAAVR